VSRKNLLKCGSVLASVVVGVFGLMGCEEDSTTAENKITIEAIGNVTGTAGTQVAVQGEIEADATPTVTAVIQNSTGGGVPAAELSVTFTDPTDDKPDLADDMAMTIVVGANGACNGTYSLVITATTTTSVSQSAPFTVTGGRDCGLTEATVTLGAQDATPGSLLDADAMVVYLTGGNTGASTPVANRPDCDVLFYYSTVAPADYKFIAPDTAQGVLTSWTAQEKANTSFKKVVANFDNIATQGDIDLLWANGGTSSKRLSIAVNDVIVINTSAGAYKAVRIESLTGSLGAAVISVKGKY